LIQRQRVVWRLAVPVVAALAGVLAVTGAVSSQGTDLRGGRYTDLASLIAAQRRQLSDLRTQADRLGQQVSTLRRQVDDIDPTALDRAIAGLATPAGLTALKGPGVIVTMDDAPAAQPTPPGANPNVLVVHQQDLQAVINALWAGGAEGVSLQNQRVVSTTGVKCVGNTVVLQGVPYAPPYRIVAVGNVAGMYDALRRSREVQNYLAYTAPPYNLGWALDSTTTTTVPAFTGSVAMSRVRTIP
jgi:uncharacterized protein YlxW (UPF0749 family)